MTDTTIGSAAGPDSLYTVLKRRFATSLPVSLVLLVLVLAGLPLAVWLDLREMSEVSLRGQADALSAVIGTMRAYYADNVVGRLSNHATVAAANYQDIAGAIPIPATMSLEVGEKLGQAGATRNMSYRFFSDYAFTNRAPHRFDDFERQALAILREGKQASVAEVTGSILDRQVRLATPIVMGAACVSCHNAHPDSPKKDWKIGDVRGLEEFTVTQRIGSNIFAFKYLLLYFLLVGAVGTAFIALQHHQSAVIARINGELGKTNQFLAGVAQKLAKYLSPQHYRSIFSGEKDVVVATERKKLTIFFSDVVGFTSSSERLQPEELTGLLNEYLTEMSHIAMEHGGTVNKFIGDAILVFFGDPETRGAVEDARACLRMSFAMQHRLDELNVTWRKRGIEEPFRCRIGINTGYCNVGNFGSDARMDYTIIGAEANLAARLQSIARPGGILLSYETFSLVSEMVQAHALEPITLKGIGRPIIPYEVEGVAAERKGGEGIIAEHTSGLDLLLDMRAVDPASTERVTHALEAALAAVRKTKPGAEAPLAPAPTAAE